MSILCAECGKPLEGGALATWEPHGQGQRLVYRHKSHVRAAVREKAVRSPAEQRQADLDAIIDAYTGRRYWN